MKQQTIHVSFPQEETALYHELMRESSLTYIPLATLCRQRIKTSLQDKPVLSRLSPLEAFI